MNKTDITTAFGLYTRTHEGTGIGFIFYKNEIKNMNHYIVKVSNWSSFTPVYLLFSKKESAHEF